MGESRNLTYDTLLRPVQDSLLKDWKLSLSVFLCDFMNHLGETEKMNFSEAAMIVQNGTAFYCKRVDVVYKTIHEFVSEICSRHVEDADHQGSQKTSEGKKKRKIVRSLEMDDLELLGFVASDSAIDAKINSIILQGLPKKILLCSSLKTLQKAGTSVTVYQESGSSLGGKDEFRITGKTHSDGTVNEDFNFDQGKTITPVDETSDHDDDRLIDNSFQDDDFIDRCNDSQPPPEHQVDEVPPSPLINQEQPSAEIFGFSTLPVSAMIPVGTERSAPARPKIIKNGLWEPIPSDFKIPIKALKTGKSICIPPKCLDEEMVGELEAMTVKLRKRKRKEKELKESEDGVKIMWIHAAIRTGLIDRSAVNILKEKDHRKQLPALKSKTTNPIHDDSFEGPEDFGLDDFEALQDDNELVSATPINRFDAMIQEQERPEFVDVALKAIEKYREARKENASRQTDIAKRVAKWHEAITPILAKAEARSHLDVHEYGTKILNMFPDDDPNFILPFHEIVMNEPANEICRYFLATLMLANTYNVEIIKHDTPLVDTQGKYCDHAELRLLTKVRHHEEMDEALRRNGAES